MLERNGRLASGDSFGFSASTTLRRKLLWNYLAKSLTSQFPEDSDGPLGCFRDGSHFHCHFRLDAIRNLVHGDSEYYNEMPWSDIGRYHTGHFCW